MGVRCDALHFTPPVTNSCLVAILLTMYSSANAQCTSWQPGETTPSTLAHRSCRTSPISSNFYWKTLSGKTEQVDSTPLSTTCLFYTSLNRFCLPNSIPYLLLPTNYFHCLLLRFSYYLVHSLCLSYPFFSHNFSLRVNRCQVHRKLHSTLANLFLWRCRAILDVCLCM